MNRFVRVAAAAAVAVGGAGSLGCVSTGKTGDCDTGGLGARGGVGGGIYRTFVDPCYPERYNVVARSEVLAPFAAQVHNGHVLNQTIWNWYFEAGTDQLNAAGKAKLDSIAQTRPGPDPRLYLQVARDVGAGAENFEKLAGVRDDLTAKRAAVVQQYMASQPSIHPVAYEIFVHDPVVPGIYADFAMNSFRSSTIGYRGGIPSGAGGGGGPGSAIATGGGTAVVVGTPTAGGAPSGGAGGSGSGTTTGP